MKNNVLSCILVNCVFVLSSTFCSDMFITKNGTNINNSILSRCISENMQRFGYNTSVFDKSHIGFLKKNNISISYCEYIRIINSSFNSEELFKWYYISDLCKSFFVLDKNYCVLFDEVSYESLPNSCKKLLSGNIEELKSKCDIKSAQKLSVLIAINTSWDDILSSMKEIVDKDEPLSHDYKLTEALFILHLKPSKSCNSNSVLSNLRKLFQKSNEYKDEDVLFYAECITGALACVLKHDKKIPSDFKFDVIQTSDSSWRFMKNAKKLMQAYKDNFIKEQNKMNIINNKNKEENNKKKVYNILQDEEKIKLKQD